MRFLHTDPRFFYGQEEDLVAGYRAIAERADHQLAAFFGTLPRLSYRVLPIPTAIARSDNTAQDERAIEAEVNRYVSSPALGLAYKLGELKFKELRAEARKELGPAFDLRAFHDEVLRHGALPLDLLEQNVKAWLAARKAAEAPGHEVPQAGQARDQEQRP